MATKEAESLKKLSENMSNSTKYNVGDIIFHPKLINITPSDIFDDNFTVNNTAGLNFSITYNYQGTQYEVKDNVTITVVEDTQW